MDHWQIGNVTVTRIQEMEIPIPYNEAAPFMAAATPEALKPISWLYPDYVTPEGHLRLSIHALLVDAPGIKLVVDTCVGNDKPRGITGGQALQTDFLARLESAGWHPDAVDVVVCTHLHVDHVGWNTMKVGDTWQPTFPNARYLIGRDEYEFWSKDTDADQMAIMADSVAPIFDAGLTDLVETDHVISPEIRLIPTTGHTPGHVSVVIESEGSRALITGDFIHHPCQIAHPEWTVGFDTDQDAAAACRTGMLDDLVDSPTLVIGTHFATPTAGKIVTEGDSRRFVT